MEDNVTPSGTSMILFALSKLNEIIHNEKYEEIIELFLKENMDKIVLNLQQKLKLYRRNSKI